jgi:glycerol-3-phosphate dehydrogenase
VFFVLPYEDKTLVGTTDTNYLGSPDEVKTEEADRNYLIEQTGRYFKNIKNVKRLGDYAGIRPLMNSGAETNAKASRRDFLIESETGHYHMIGGKLTTGRAFATRAIKKILSNHFKDKKFQKISWGFEK